MKFYIAFSIHGTNNFKVAVIEKKVVLKETNSEQIAKTVSRHFGPDFSVVTSRRPNYNESRDGIKLHWRGLQTKEGKPLKSASWVTRRFKELTKRGWKLVPAN